MRDATHCVAVARPPVPGARARARRPRRGAGLAALLCTLALAGEAAAATATELRVLCPDALRAPVLEAAREFVKGRGLRLAFEFGTPGVLQKRAAVGDAGDVLIATASGAEALVKLGRALEGSVGAVGTVGVGVAVPASGARPDVSTPESLRLALLQAGRVIVPEAGPGFSAAHVERMFERLGVADDVRAKRVAVRSVAEALERVAGTEGALGLAPAPAIVAAAGVALAGPVPRGLQQGVAYAAVVLRMTRDETAARAFVAHLTSEPVRIRWHAAGVDVDAAERNQ